MVWIYSKDLQVVAWNKSASENQKPNSAPKKKSVALSKLTLGVDLE